MEDASAVDLDWFWRGWFYTTDNCDQNIEQVRWLTVRKPNQTIEKKEVAATKGDLAAGTGAKKNTDFSNGPEPITILPTPDNMYGEFRSRLNDKQTIEKLENKNMYEVTLTNKGGLVMPVILEWTYKDGSKEIDRLPAEIWRVNESRITKVFVKEKEVVKVVLDPKLETSDINITDNVFPKVETTSKIDQLKKN
jgi:hypothetical protein